VPWVDITVTGERENARRLMRVGERGMDMRPIFSVLSDDWDNIVDEQFELVAAPANLDAAAVIVLAFRFHGV